MTKFISSPGSAYETAVGVTAEEAREQGLAIVELSYSTRPPTPIFGRYKDAPNGSPLGVTVDDNGNRTKVVGAGGGAFPTDPLPGDKGSLLNINDPVVHGGTGDKSVHADGAPPLANDALAQEELLRAGAHDFTKAPEAGKKLAK